MQPITYFRKSVHLLQTDILANVLIRYTKYNGTGVAFNCTKEGNNMPSYFCCKCQKLMTTDSQTVPNAFVCAMCRKESSAEVMEDVSSPETTDEQNFVICSISERK